MSFNFEPKGLDDILDAIERLHEWFRVNHPGDRRVGNWIKPEKCDGPIVNLDLCSHLSTQCSKRGYLFYVTFVTQHEEPIEWSSDKEGDFDHDYQRVLKQLGLA